ncbi:MAG: glycosyltransferase family 4 protein [Bacteroidota bacterium]
MEILFVSHKHPPSVGGMQKQSYELVNGMRKYAKVHALVYNGNGNLLRFFITLNRRINKICRQNPGISVIHYNDGLMAALCLLHRGYDHLAKTVTLHGLDVVFPAYLFRRYVLPKFNGFRYIFAVSQATAAACIKLGLKAEKVVVIANGVDPQIATFATSVSFETIAKKHHFSTTGRTILVAWGRAVKRKGFSWFAREVMPKLNHDCILLIIGPFNSKPRLTEYLLGLMPGRLKHLVELFFGHPSDERNVRKILRDPAIKGKVKQLGTLSFPEIVSVLRRSDAFVMPNIKVEGDMEGFGLVCLEASLMGTSVFASDIDGIPDAIHHGRNGILIQPGNSVAWADALNKGISNDSHKPSTDEAMNYTLQTFGWDKMVKRYFLFFSDCEPLQHV